MNSVRDILNPVAARRLPVVAVLLWVCACTHAVPTEKVAHYDPAAGGLVLPAPCPDWSLPQTTNYGNAVHSNYGCAVNSNAALQLDRPAELLRGHGDSGPNGEFTAKAISDYRAGTLPMPTPPASSATTGSGGE